MSSVNPKKLKVAELKKELEDRDIPLPKNAKKADLVALLLSAIESESEQEKEFSSEALDDSVVSGADGESQADDKILEEEDLKQVPNDDAAQEKQPEPMQAEPEEPAEPEPEVPKEDAVADDSKPIEEPIEPQAVENEQSNAEQEPAEIKPEETTEKEPEASAPQEAEDIKQMETDDKTEAEAVSDQTDTAQSAVDNKESVENSENQADGEQKPAKEEAKHEAGRKRRHDDRSDRHSRWEDRYAPPEEEPEEDFDDTIVALDIYNSDLNFKVSRDRFGGSPLTMEGFAYLWAGARATYGVKNGKVFFECKVVEEDAVKHLPSDEPHPHVVRVGWSVDHSSLQLGEEALSYGYGGTGKFSVECKFSDYGETFREGDVIGCYLDSTSEENVKISYTKNGKYLDVAHTEEKSKLQEKALFPHVLCKNTGVELNFGQREEPYFPNPTELEDYVFISTVPREEMVRAIKGPEAKKDCEVLMMCGIPGAGKTYYSNQLMKDHPEKKYNVLGTNAIMEKMRIMGVARKRNYANRWELLIQNSTQCLNRLLQIACRKRRNYILDQTNVYASAQRRKMRPFEGFHRKAVVIVPTEEEYKSRFDNRTKEEGKEVPESAILEMKANFSIPEEGNLFDEVIFTELGQEEAQKLVEKYREEGRKNGPPPEKRSRGGGDRNRGRDGGSWRHPRGYRGPPGPMYGNGAPWGRFGGGPMGYGRGGFGGPGGFRGRGGGGFGNRQGGFGRGGGRGGSGSGSGDGRDFNRRNDRGGHRGKGGWQDFSAQGGRGGGGGYGGYNRQSQGRGFSQNRGSFQNSSGGNQYQGRGNAHSQKFQQGNRMHNSQSSAPHSAQSYTYGHHHSTNQQQQQFNSQNMGGYNTGGYNFSQQNQQQQQQQQQQQSAPAAPVQNAQAQQQAYQQAYGQQDYSQQWAQYYQQQAQNQQYQNYYANYQQYYNQQAAQQTPQQ